MTPFPTQWPHTTLQFRGDTLEGIKFHGPYSEGDIERHHDFPPDLGVIRRDAAIFHKDAKQQPTHRVKEKLT